MLRLLTLISSLLLIAPPAIESTITEHVFQNVHLPYNVKFPEDVKPGMLVVVDGMAQSDPDRFAIDFVRDVGNNRDVVFHLNPRFKQRSVVRNTQINGWWGREERERNLMPIKPKERFEIAILVTNSAYKVFINGKHFTDYRHRLPYSSVTHLGIWGHIYVSKLSIRFNPLFATMNNILPFLKPATGNLDSQLIRDIFSKKMSGKLFENLKSKGKKNIRFHFDMSVDDPQNDKFLRATKKNGKPGLRIDANIPVNKK